MLNNAKECLANEFLIDSRKSNYMMILSTSFGIRGLLPDVWKDYKACYNSVNLVTIQYVTF